MKFLHDLSALTPNLTVSSQDEMVSPGAEGDYFDLGKRALDLILFSAELCDKPHYPEILDLPCGHGRVLRWLRAQYGYANITACDLNRDGVEFCRTEFGAQGVDSVPDLAALPFKDQFDLVWCGSLLTHLPVAEWRKAIDCLIRWTKDCGVVVFSVQGRFFSSVLARGEGSFAENVDMTTLLRDFARDGVAFQPYYEEPAGRYGITVVSPEFLTRVLQGYPNVIVRAYLEQAWGVQDVVILYKREGHHVPLLSASPVK